MARITTSAGDELFYREDCFAPPWEDPPVTLLLHAEAETGDAWYGWVPRMAARARVIRPDMRGAGRSVPMRPGQAWSLDRFASDVVALLDGIGVKAAHVVASRFAGPVGMRLAAAYPDRVLTLTLCSTTPCPAGHYAERAARWAEAIEARGIDAWSVDAAQDRLGTDAEEEMLEGWSHMLAGADPATLAGLFRNLAAFDARRDVEAIGCPVLVAANGGNAAMPLEVTTEWQRRIARSDLLVMTGRGDHVAATHARDLAGAVQEFQRKIIKESAGARRGARREAPAPEEPRHDRAPRREAPAAEDPRRDRAARREAPAAEDPRRDRAARREERRRAAEAQGDGRRGPEAQGDGRRGPEAPGERRRGPEDRGRHRP
jgi:pimeloyl-ACP methyl ester carboxylesterase